MITVDKFLSAVADIASRNPQYKLGHSGDDGFCDCIGLPIGALQENGEKWGGTHGTNWAIRNAVTGTKQFSSMDELELGQLVFKARSPGESGYSLPDRYKSGSDLKDYYHVGVVTRVNPTEITHMTSPSIKRDYSRGKWSYRTNLKKVGDAPVEYEEVVISGGVLTSPINMRAEKSTGSKLIERIPQGSRAELIEEDGSWDKIRYAGKTGYVKSEFVTHLTGEFAPDQDDNIFDNDLDTVTVGRTKLESIYDELNDANKLVEHVYDELGDILGLRG